jgi:chromosome segregation ATPase
MSDNNERTTDGTPWPRWRPLMSDFKIERRGAVDVLVWGDSGGRPATSSESALWSRLEAAELDHDRLAEAMANLDGGIEMAKVVATLDETRMRLEKAEAERDDLRAQVRTLTEQLAAAKEERDAAEERADEEDERARGAWAVLQAVGDLMHIESLDFDDDTTIDEWVDAAGAALDALVAERTAAYVEALRTVCEAANVDLDPQRPEQAAPGVLDAIGAERTASLTAEVNEAATILGYTDEPGSRAPLVDLALAVVEERDALRARFAELEGENADLVQAVNRP